jgi:hypothetical protein
MAEEIFGTILFGRVVKVQTPTKDLLSPFGYHVVMDHNYELIDPQLLDNEVGQGKGQLLSFPTVLT